MKALVEQVAPDCAVGFYGNVFVRSWSMQRGQSGPSHKHTFDHMTIVTRGKVRVDIEGGSSFQVTEGGFFPVPKEQEHQVTALEDSVFWCVFAIRDQEGNVVDGDCAEEFYAGFGTPSGAVLPPDIIK